MIVKKYKARERNQGKGNVKKKKNRMTEMKEQKEGEC